MTNIDLKEFIEGYKKSEVFFEKQKWTFREPAVKDLQLSVMEILEKYCIEGNFQKFKKIVTEDIPVSKQKEFINQILEDLGLV